MKRRACILFRLEKIRLNLVLLSVK